MQTRSRNHLLKQRQRAHLLKSERATELEKNARSKLEVMSFFFARTRWSAAEPTQEV